MEPEELRAEKRWSNIPQHSAPNGYWAKHLDEKLLVLVTNATASGDRFPVGVNWLDISRSIGYSPVECLKRYAFLHSARERLSMQGEAPAMDRVAARMEQTNTRHGEDDGAHTDDTNNPFSGMSSSDDLGSPNSRAFLEYGSPIASPRLQSLENSGEFGVGGAPDSPPPFALRAAYKGERGGVTVTSPLRWENLAKDTYSSSPPVLSAPPHVLRQQQLRTSFGVVGTEDPAMKQSTYEGVHSPRIVHGTQHHSRFTDPNFAAEIVNDAFRGLRLGDDLPPPTATSPRMARAISNSEFPFLSEDDRKTKPNVAPPISMGARVGARRASDAGPNPPHPLRHAASPGSPMLASFQTDNPFSESLTQSALEEAFLDMAGSRLDASSMLFASRYAASQSRVMNEPPHNQSKSLQRDPVSLSRHQSWSHPQQRQ